MKLLRLNGKYAVDGREFAKVDDNIYEELNSHRWYVDKTYNGKFRSTYYARSVINGKKVSLHRYIMNFPILEVDHINHDTLDNQLHNLRLTTHSNNIMNCRHRFGTTSIYKGVSWDKSRLKWEAYIHYDNKRHHLGRFFNEFDAAIAYNDASFTHHKEFANVNRLPYGIARCEKEEVQL